MKWKCWFGAKQNNIIITSRVTQLESFLVVIEEKVFVLRIFSILFVEQQRKLPECNLHVTTVSMLWNIGCCKMRVILVYTYNFFLFKKQIKMKDWQNILSYYDSFVHLFLQFGYQLSQPNNILSFECSYYSIRTMKYGLQTLNLILPEQ